MSGAARWPQLWPLQEMLMDQRERMENQGGHTVATPEGGIP